MSDIEKWQESVAAIVGIQSENIKLRAEIEALRNALKERTEECAKIADAEQDDEGFGKYIASKIRELNKEN